MSAPRNQDGLNKYSTVDATYKLIGSLPPPRKGRDVSTMDKFISRKLQGNLINDSDLDAIRPRSLCFFLDLIFAGFNEEFGDVTPESLILPLSSIAKEGHQFIPHKNLDGTVTESVQLYDTEKKRWRWSFPPTEQPQPGAQAKPLKCESQIAMFLNTIAVAFGVTRAQSNKSFPQQPLRRWLGSKSTTSVPGSTGYVRKPDLILVDNAPLAPDEITWLSPKVIGEYTKESFQPSSRLGKTMDTKAYLVLVEQPWRRFILGISIANSELRVHFYDHSGGAYSSAFNIHTNAQQFLFIIAALAFGSRTSIGFDPTLEIRPRLRDQRRGSTRKGANDACGRDPTTEGTEQPAIVLDPSGLVEEPVPISFPSGSSGPIEDPTRLSITVPLSPEPAKSSQAGDLPLPSPSPSPEPTPAIGKVRVGDIYYDIIEILFSSKGFLGRGTVCYLARREEIYYVIKDHWVRDLEPGGTRDPKMIHEVEMMECVEGIVGVPKLHSAWVVEIEEKVADTTARYRVEKYRGSMLSPRTHFRMVMTPRVRPLMNFRTKRELVKCVCDVVGIIEQALERGVIHRDCSAWNAMIEDLADGGSRGFLLDSDWEFAVEVTQRSKYRVGGTGTVPFMSLSVLRQLQNAFTKSITMNAQSIRKTASLNRVFLNTPISIHHTYTDDVESLLYVLVWIMVLHDGPHGQERSDIGHKETFLALWSERAAEDLRIAVNAKYAFLTDPDNRSLDEFVTPYFQDVIPLVCQWCALHRQAQLTQSLIQISDVKEALNNFITRMRSESELPRELRLDVTRNVIPLDFTPSGSNGDFASKRLRDEVRSTDNPPVPSKHFKPV